MLASHPSDWQLEVQVWSMAAAAPSERGEEGEEGEGYESAEAAKEVSESTAAHPAVAEDEDHGHRLVCEQVCMKGHSGHQQSPVHGAHDGRQWNSGTHHTRPDAYRDERERERRPPDAPPPHGADSGGVGSGSQDRDRLDTRPGGAGLHARAGDGQGTGRQAEKVR